MGDRPFFAETPSQLKHLALQITQVADHDWPITVRDLLSWFGASRRSRRNVKRIREALDEVGLITDPDFEGENIDATVILLPKGTLYESAAEAADGLSIGDAAQAELVQKSVVLSPIQLADPAQRISRLASARKRPVSVTPDAPIGEAITLMLCHDYSQLPVMQSDHDVKGLFTWKSYGKRLAHGRKPTCVREAMDDYQGIAYDASLFEAITLITRYDCVLVRAKDHKVCGIITAYDISKQFGELAEPFLLLGDIENHIRHLISKTFTLEELQQAKDPGDESREIHDVYELTFGEYERLLQKEQNWARLNTATDRKTFIDWLGKVREIRNEIMHFDPEPITEPDMQLLRDIVGFLALWQELAS